MRVRVVNGPTAEQLTVDEVRRHLRIDADGAPLYSDDDEWITEQIPAARDLCESILGKSIAPQVMEVTADRFTRAMELPMGPVLSVLSVQYLDEAAVWQTADHQFVSGYGLILPPALAEWPAVYCQPGAVRIRYEAGYTLAGESPDTYPLPRSIRSAMLLVMGHLYENREQTSAVKLEEVPLGVYSLLERYRSRTSMA